MKERNPRDYIDECECFEITSRLNFLLTVKGNKTYEQWIDYLGLQFGF